MSRMLSTVLTLVMTGIIMLGVAPGHASENKRSTSGKTQIVAKLNNREITITDLRYEMNRLGLNPASENAEAIALESIVSRALLTDAARSARFHRKPESLRHMAVAQEQALADLYLASTSRASEPTREELERFVFDNPALFSKRRIYTFSVLTLDTTSFDEEAFTPLFDDSADFDALRKVLLSRRVDTIITPAVQAAEAFAAPVRDQLAVYKVRDNIVLKSPERVQIMKITAIKNAPITGDHAMQRARELIFTQQTRKRAERVLKRLRESADLNVYRASATRSAEVSRQ